jgi:hypothetical protein
MITPPKKNPTLKIKRTANQKWTGLNTSGGRVDTPQDGLWVADNIVVNNEGSLSSRAAFVGSRVPDLPSDVFVGPITSYYNTLTAKNDLMTICNGLLYRYQPGEADWELVPLGDDETSVEFSMDQQAVYAQYSNMLVIADGVNPMAYYILETETTGNFVTRPGSEITTNPTITLAHESGAPTSGNYAAYYLVSYVNDFGETPATATPDASLRIDLTDEDKPLGTWATPVRITIASVTTTLENNTRVRIYRVLSPDFVAPSITSYQLVSERPVAEFVAGTFSFVDDGSVAGRVLAPQLENSTGGLAARFVYEIDGRLWALGVGKEIQKVYYTGAAPTDSAYPQFFAGDGGYFYAGYGTSFIPATVRRGMSDDGTICNFVSGPGRRFNIFSLATEYGSQTVHQFYPSEQRGDDGAYSTLGVLDYLNSIIYPSPSGFKSSGLKANYTADNVSALIDKNISDIVSSIPASVFNNIYGTMYDGKAIWHIGPSTMLVFDAKNNGAWTRWTFPHLWFGALKFDNDRLALYAVRGTSVVRYSDLAEFRPRDAFFLSSPVKLSSGRLVINPDDGREWVRLVQVLFVFSALEGPIKITLRANSRRRIETFTGEIQVDQDLFGQPYLTGSEPVEFGGIDSPTEIERGPFGTQVPFSAGPFITRRDETSGLVEIRLRVNKDVNFLDWTIESAPGFLGFKFDEFVYEYVKIGVGLDFSSRYNEVRLGTTRG